MTAPSDAADEAPPLRARLAASVGKRAALLVAVGALTWLDRLWWPLEVLSHARVHLAALILVGAVVLAWTRRPLRALAAAVAAVVFVVPALPMFFGESAAPESDTVLRVLLLNVRTENQVYADVRALVAEIEPDVLVIQELNGTWERELHPLRAAYPHGHGRPRADNFGIAVWSRLPLEGEVRTSGGLDLPSVVERVGLGSEAVRIIATHPIGIGDGIGDTHNPTN